MDAIRIVWKPNKVALVEWDLPDEKINKLDRNTVFNLDKIIDELLSQECSAAVFISRKKNIFIAGADIKELDQDWKREELKSYLDKVHGIFRKIETAPFPVVAAIEGACLGGGLELALACHYRIVSDHSSTQLGLPEVKLGLIPGFGGCYRLPRILGLLKSLEFITSGRSFRAQKAFKAGLADQCVASGFLEKRALEFATSQLGSRPRQKKYVPRGLVQKLWESVLVRPLIKYKSKKMIMEKTGGHYPAPLDAVDVIVSAYKKPYEFVSDLEASYFSNLMTSKKGRDVSKGLIGLFYATELVKKFPVEGYTPDGEEPVSSVAVFGPGVMGSGIAYSFANKGFATRLLGINDKDLLSAKKHIYSLWERAVRRRRLSKVDFEKRSNLLSLTTDPNTIQSSDLVIEAVLEDPEVKHQLFTDLSHQVSSDCIVATNTSSLRVSDLAKSYAHPENFLGVHFFNPVPKMPLVEIVRGDSTSDRALYRAFQAVKKMGKTPILVKDKPLFLVNRILTPYLIECVRMAREGVSFSRIDSIFKDFGMPMGPFRLMDEVGFGVVRKVLENYMSNFSYFGENMVIGEASGVGGRHTLKGFYNYDNKGTQLSENEQMYSLIKAKSRTSDMSDQIILQRGLYVILNEVARVLVEDEVITSASMCNLASIMGIGFPASRGGVVKYLDDVGVDTVISALKSYEKRYGQQYTPSSGLLSLAGKKVSDIY